MSKSMRREQVQRRAAARRSGALARNELREPSSPREPAAGATSFPVKAVDPAVESAIAAFLAKKQGGVE